MIPLFKSHHSIGKSILTLTDPDNVEDGGPDSIVDLCLKHGLTNPFLVEDSMGGFLEAALNFQKQDIDYRFGLRMDCVGSVYGNDDDRKDSLHKIVIFIKNRQGYNDLLRIHNREDGRDTFLGKPYTDCGVLRELWTENLLLGIPFYDSYLFNNNFTFGNCVPEFDFTKPIYFIENNGLPFDENLGDIIRGVSDNWVNAKTILYNKREDFVAWQTYKCVTSPFRGRARTLERPELPHCCSDEFCLESYLEKCE